MKKYFTTRRSLAYFVFFTSLLLSVLACYTSPVLNRDGMFYVSLGQMLADGQLEAVLSTFNWPFFPGLLALLNTIIPLSALHVAYLTTSFFAAGCATLLFLLLTRLVAHGNPRWAAFLVLSLPIINDYRSNIIRDWPAWFFMLAALLAFFSYRKAPSPKIGLVFILFLLLASLARLESALIAMPLLGWFILEKGNSTKAKLGLVLPFVVAAVMGLVSLLVIKTSLTGRLLSYWNDLNVAGLYHALHTDGQIIGEEFLRVYSRDYGTTLLVSGLLVILAIKAIKLIAISAIPWLISRQRKLPLHSRDLTYCFWLVVTWLLLDCLFMLNNRFLSSRYMVPMLLFATPILYAGLIKLREQTQDRKLWGIIIALLLIQTISSVISTKGRDKLYIKTAGLWAKAHLTATDEVYFNNSKVAFYAGNLYLRPQHNQINTERANRAEWLLLATKKSHAKQTLKPFSDNYQQVQHFDTGSNKSVILLKRQELEP